MSNNGLSNFFKSWREVTRSMELSLVDSLASTAPWLAPIIPAFLAWRNMVNVLMFPGWVALVGAFVIETLGISTVHTVFSLWDYNDSRRKSDQPAPVWISITTAIVYIMIVMVVNVMLERRPPVEMIAQALLSILSVIAAVTLAVRANHARRLTDIRDQKEQMRLDKLALRTQGAVSSSPMRTNAKRNTKPNPYVCGVCGALSETQPKLAAHMRWKHPKGNGHVSEEIAKEVLQK